MIGKKVLIVSASIGSGHNQAAKAITTELKLRYPEIKVEFADFMTGEHSYLNRLIKEAYFKMINISPNMYDLLYRWSNAPERGGKVQSLLVKIMRSKMQALINKHQPDFIIATHPFPCAAAANLKATGKTSSRLAAAITDFAAHRLWVYPQVDCYFVAAAKVSDELVQQGIKKERVHVTGIPIGSEFALPVEKFVAIERLKLNKHNPVLLIMGGGLGLGGVKQALMSAYKVKRPIQIVIVTGRNAKLRHSLKKAAAHSRHKVHVLGYTTRIRELMAAASLIITKPGALTLSEAMAAAVPIVLYESIPGQEKENAAFMAAEGAALLVEDTRHLDNKITEVLGDSNLIEKLRMNAGRISRPKAASEAADLVSRILYSEDSHSVCNLNAWREKACS